MHQSSESRPHLRLVPRGVLLACVAVALLALPVLAAGLKPPAALSYTITENASLFVSNATMLAGQPSNASVQTTDLTEWPPNWGKITGSASGITYVPQVGYVGADAFSYTICLPPAGAEQACLSNFVYLTITATASPSALPSSVGTPEPSSAATPVPSPTGVVGGATGRPRATPPATAGSTPKAPTDANLVVLAGLAIIITGMLLLVPADRSRRRSRR